jgi:hypothetical protein
MRTISAFTSPAVLAARLAPAMLGLAVGANIAGCSRPQTEPPSASGECRCPQPAPLPELDLCNDRMSSSFAARVYAFKTPLAERFGADCSTWLKAYYRQTIDIYCDGLDRGYERPSPSLSCHYATALHYKECTQSGPVDICTIGPGDLPRSGD